jgi:hypothetical protein
MRCALRGGNGFAVAAALAPGRTDLTGRQTLPALSILAKAIDGTLAGEGLVDADPIGATGIAGAGIAGGTVCILATTLLADLSATPLAAGTIIRIAALGIFDAPLPTRFAPCGTCRLPPVLVFVLVLVVVLAVLLLVLAPGADRGALCTWNEQPKGDAECTGQGGAPRRALPERSRQLIEVCTLHSNPPHDTARHTWI